MFRLLSSRLSSIPPLTSVSKVIRPTILKPSLSVSTYSSSFLFRSAVTQNSSRQLSSQHSIQRGHISKTSSTHPVLFGIAFLTATGIFLLSGPRQKANAETEDSQFLNNQAKKDANERALHKKPLISSFGSLIGEAIGSVWREQKVTSISDFLYSRIKKEQVKWLGGDYVLPAAGPEVRESVPYTLLVDPYSFVCVADWNANIIVRRPGLKEMLDNISKRYELIAISPFTVKLAKRGAMMMDRSFEYFQWHLGSEANIWLKNPESLNRDMRKVIILDPTGYFYKYYPDNTIIMEGFLAEKPDGEWKDDYTAYALDAFLEEIYENEEEDVRKVVRHYQHIDFIKSEFPMLPPTDEAMAAFKRGDFNERYVFPFPVRTPESYHSVWD